MDSDQRRLALEELERAVLGEMYEFLCSFSPSDPGRSITHRVKRGKRYRVGRTRLYVPTRCDEYESAYWGGGDLHRAGLSFAERFVRVSEEYITDRGDTISGRELLEKHGAVVGRDAVESIESFLEAALAVDAISLDQGFRLGRRFGVSRATLAALAGPLAKVHIITRRGSSKRAFVVFLSDPFAD